MNPVAILMPVYNGERFLAKAINSILDQDFLNWKLIIVDDGSTDKSPDIAQSYLNDSRISYIRQLNSGVATARNRALDASDSKYIALLDQDDIWYPGKLSSQIKLLQSDDELVLVHSNIDFIDANDGPTTGDNMMWVGPYQGNCTIHLLNGNGVAPLTALFSREVMINAGGFQPSEAPADDWGLWLRMSRSGRFSFISTPLGAYRVHESNETHKRVRMRKAEIQVLKSFRQDTKASLSLNERLMLKWKLIEIYRALGKQYSYEGDQGLAFVFQMKSLLGTFFSPKHYKDVLRNILPLNLLRACRLWIKKRLRIF